MNQEQRLRQYDAQVAEARQLFDERNRVYRDAFAEGGVDGCLLELMGAAKRLKRMRYELLVSAITGDADRLRDAVAALRAVLPDLLNYAAMAGMLLDEGRMIGTEGD